MRLIDADELITTVLAHDLCDTEQIDKDILEAPTIEAIPVKWLLDLRSRYFEADCPMSVCVVNEILNLWRKENDL